MKRSILVPLVLLATACADAKTAVVGPRERFTGEDLYRGLILGEGDVAQLVPEVHRYSPADRVEPEVRAAVAGVQHRLMAGIAEAEPTFFASFEHEIESGSPVRVDAALQRAAELTLTTFRGFPETQKLAGLMETDPATFKSMLKEGRRAAGEAADDLPPEEEVLAEMIQIISDGEDRSYFIPCRPWVCGIYALVVVWLEFAVAQDYALAFNVWTYFNYDVFWNIQNGTDPLIREKFVRSIVENLG